MNTKTIIKRIKNTGSSYYRVYYEFNIHNKYLKFSYPSIRAVELLISLYEKS